MSAPTTPRIWRARLDPAPGPEVTVARSLPSGNLYLRQPQANLRREWLQHTGFRICTTYESWSSLLLLSPDGVEDATEEWEASQAARLERERALVADTPAGDAA